MIKNIDVTHKPTPEQIKMLENAGKFTVSEDDEYPAFTEKKIGRQKQTVTLRLSGQALNKAKSLGKGYTSILSRILESALEDPELVKHYL